MDGCGSAESSLGNCFNALDGGFGVVDLLLFFPLFKILASFFDILLGDFEPFGDFDEKLSSGEFTDNMSANRFPKIISGLGFVVLCARGIRYGLDVSTLA